MEKLRAVGQDGANAMDQSVDGQYRSINRMRMRDEGEAFMWQTPEYCSLFPIETDFTDEGHPLRLGHESIERAKESGRLHWGNNPLESYERWAGNRIDHAASVACERHGITRAELCTEHLGVGKNAIAGWKKRPGTIPKEKALRLCDLAGITLRELRTGEAYDEGTAEDPLNQPLSAQDLADIYAGLDAFQRRTVSGLVLELARLASYDRDPKNQYFQYANQFFQYAYEHPELLEDEETV